MFKINLSNPSNVPNPSKQPIQSSAPIHSYIDISDSIHVQSSNAELITEFEKLIEFWIERSKIDKTKTHSHKINAFKKALYSLTEYPKKITSKQQAMNEIAGIGKGIGDRIEQFLIKGTFDDFSLDLSESDKLMIDLQNVYGIGIKKANDFIKMGIKSINELKILVSTNKLEVIPSIKIGLKYYDDFKQRIPRDEITRIYNRINTTLSKYPRLIIEIAGSYRRELQTSGDIDVLITYNNSQDFLVDDGELDNPIKLSDIIKELESSGILVDNLTNDGQKKYMGVTKDLINNIGRRIDILFVPYENYYYSLLYFTGSKWLNTKMRSIAETMNMRLNEYSLTDNFTGKKFLVNSEKDIFDILKIKYLHPNKR